MTQLHGKRQTTSLSCPCWYHAPLETTAQVTIRMAILEISQRHQQRYVSNGTPKKIVQATADFSVSIPTTQVTIPNAIVPPNGTNNINLLTSDHSPGSIGDLHGSLDDLIGPKPSKPSSLWPSPLLPCGPLSRPEVRTSETR